MNGAFEHGLAETALARASAQLTLWRYVWKLLRMRIVLQISAFRRAKLRRKIGMALLGLLFLAFLGFVFFLSWQLLKLLNNPEVVEYVGDMSALLNSVPVVLVSAAFIGILLTSFGVLLQALYLAGDMDFLLSTPIPIRAVFLSKLLQAILPNFSLICLFALPVLFGLGLAQGYNFLYYPLALIMLAALALAAAGISSLLVMLVVRVFPARRVAEVIGFVGATFSFLCSQSGNLARFNDPTPEQGQQALQMLQRANAPWSPLAWAGRGLVGIGEANWLPGLGFTLLTLGLAGAIFYFALNTAERLYYTGWASMAVSKQRKKKAPAAPTAIGRQSQALFAPLKAFVEKSLPAPLRAIAIKDWVMMRRDLRNMSQLITPLIFGLVYAVMLLRGGGEAPPGRGEAPEWFMDVLSNAMVYSNVGLSLFVSWMLIGRLAGMGFSQEGKSYWLLKSSPVGVPQLIGAKFLVAYLPVLVISWGFLVIIWFMQAGSLGVLLFSLPVVALSIAGNAGINLAFGISGANMNWEDPRHMQNTSSGCLGTLVVMGYLPLSLVLFFGPAIGLQMVGLPESVGQVVGLVLGGAFSLAFAVVPLWLVRNKVPRLGEA